MLTGTLKKFFPDKGFGFIAPDNGTPDLFAHKRALQGADESSIREGLKVSFLSEVEDRTNKPKASTWRILDAGALAAGALGADALGGLGTLPGLDYSALAAASFGAVQAATDPRFSPYGTMPGLAMPGAMPAGAAGLPLGWEQVTDPNTGKPYYCNRATGESSWTVPVAAAPAAAAMPTPAPVAVAATPGLPPGWEQANDPGTGNSYYFNRATGQTQWTPPTAEPAATAPAAT